MRPSPGRHALPRRLPGVPPIAVAAVFLVASSLAAPPAAAGKIIGPNDCTQCHDHDAQTKAWQKHQHFRSLDVFEGPKAKEFLKKLAIKDPYSDLCTGCHATVVDGSADFGVSCESCHGGASDFLKPHQQKGSYEKAITLGMLRTKDLAVRAKNCVGCHLVREKKILDVGHPTGASFDLVEGSKKILHWQEGAPPDQIAAAWRSAVASAGGLVAVAPPAAQAVPVQVPAAKPPATAAAQPPAATPSPVPPAGNAVKPVEERAPAPAPAAARPLPVSSLPPDEQWPPDLPALDSVASLQARLILVLNKLLAESGGAKQDAGTVEAPSAGASSPEARLIDLQRRVLALQRKLLASSGK